MTRAVDFSFVAIAACIIFYGQVPSIAITNIDFENSTVAAWGIEGGSSDFSFVADSEHPHAGKMSARLSVIKAADGIRRRYISIPFPRERKFSRILVKFHIKTDGIAAGAATVNVLENSPKGVVGWLTGKATFIPLTPSADWMNVEKNAEVNPATTGLVFYLAIENKDLAAGSLWIDDIVVEGIPDIPQIKFSSTAEGNIFTTDNGVIKLTVPDANDLTSGRVSLIDENGTVLREIVIPPGQLETSLELNARGYYSVIASASYRSGFSITNRTSAAVIGAPIPDAVRLASPLGFFGVGGASNFTINAGGAWSRSFLGMQSVTSTSAGYALSQPINLLIPTNEKRIVCLWPSPVWIMDPPPGKTLKPWGHEWYPPKDWNVLSNIVRFVFDRPHTVQYLEVMNEPDANWKGSQEDLVNYHAVVSRAVKSVNPGIRIIGPGMYSIRIDDLDKLVKLGILEYLDGISIHAYVNGTAPEGEFIAAVIALKKYLASIGRKDLPIYFTEFGWTSMEGTWQKPVDEITQARYLVRSLALLTAEHIDGLNYFCMLYQTPNTGEHNFSILRTDTTPKPAYAAHAAFARHIAGNEGSMRVMLSPTTHLVLLLRQDRAAAVLWDVNGTSFDLPSSTARVTDMMGRPLVARTVTAVGPSPIFFDMADPQFARPVMRAPISVVIGKKTGIPLRDIAGIASLSVKNGELSTTLNTPPGRYALIGRNGTSWEVQPIDVISPLATEACRLEWPLDDTVPTLAMPVTSIFSAPVQVRARLAFDTAHDLFHGAVTLGSNEQRMLRIPLTGISEGRRYTGRFIAETTADFMYHHRAAPFDVTIVSAPLCADGTAESRGSFMNISDYGPFIDADSAKPFNTDECSARISFSASDAGLRLRAAVNDDMHRQEKRAPNMWAEDSLQIAFDVDRDEPWRPNSGKWFNGHRIFEYGIAQGTTETLVWRWISHSDLPAMCGEPRIRAGITREGTITRYDILFPWAVLGLSERPAAGRTFGIALAVNDIDGAGSRRHGLRLFGGIVESKDPLSFGQLFFR